MRKLYLCVVLMTVAAPSAAQQDAARPAAPPRDATLFADDGAADLLRRARAARASTDGSLRSYTAVVRSRLAAGMRMPLKDRTLFRQESAARVRWSRDAETVVQLLAVRVQHPGGVEAPTNHSGWGVDELYDPTRDRMYFGLTTGTRGPDDDDDFWIEHPLGDEAERHYRYSSGDTLTIRLQGGQAVRVLELRVSPRRDDPHTVRGTLWIDAESGALVQAAFRLARTVDILRDIDIEDEDDDLDRVPGFLKPFEFDISLITVEYSLWEMKHWLPRTMRIEGMARAGILKFPASADLSYDMLDVEVDGVGVAPDSAAARATARQWAEAGDFRRINRTGNGRKFVLLAPRDTAELLRSEQLPPPIWKDAPGFAREDELKELYDRIATIPGPAAAVAPARFGWGFGEPDMLRYNRVEGLSLGARVTVPLPQVELSATARLGVADLHPNVELRVRQESMRRTLELRAYHELATAHEDRHALGLGNSVSAALLGRDEGEYYRASGAALTWAPPKMRRRSWDITGYLEQQDAVARETHVALPRVWHDSVFRSNITADEAVQYGALLRLRPWWGSDPHRAQFGIDVMVQPETGDFEHVRGRVTLRAAAPFVHGVRIGAEAAAGSSTGDVPRQRLFYLGGASTLRGYEPSTVAGTSMARARLELARTASFGNLAIFSDWGWAGDRDLVRSIDQRLAVGIGVSTLDGLIRLDLARALRAPKGWRLDLHLDALM